MTILSTTETAPQHLACGTRITASRQEDTRTQAPRLLCLEEQQVDSFLILVFSLGRCIVHNVCARWLFDVNQQRRKVCWNTKPENANTESVAQNRNLSFQRQIQISRRTQRSQGERSASLFFRIIVLMLPSNKYMEGE